MWTPWESKKVPKHCAVRNLHKGDFRQKVLKHSIWCCGPQSNFVSTMFFKNIRIRTADDSLLSSIMSHLFFMLKHGGTQCKIHVSLVFLCFNGAKMPATLWKNENKVKSMCVCVCRHRHCRRSLSSEAPCLEGISFDVLHFFGACGISSGVMHFFGAQLVCHFIS